MEMTVAPARSYGLSRNTAAAALTSPRARVARRGGPSPEVLVTRFHAAILSGVARAMTWASDRRFYFDCEDLAQDFVVALLDRRSSVAPPADGRAAAAYVRTSAFHYALGRIRKEQHRRALVRSHSDLEVRPQCAVPSQLDRLVRFENCSAKDHELLHLLELGWSVPRVAAHWGQTKWAVYKRIERLRAPIDW